MITSFSRKRNILGIIYGLIAGLSFSLAAWGMDVFILLRHSVSLPFVRFVPGLVISVPAAVLVGYLTARFEKGWLSMFLWVALAVLFTELVIIIPVKVAPWLTSKLLPEFIPVIRFSELANLGHYWFYGIFAIGFSCILCGILENLFIDQSLASSSSTGAVVPYILCLLIMTGAGFSGDLLMTSHYREPVVTIDVLLENGARYYNEEIEKTEARKMRLSIVDPLGELVLQPYTLTLVSTDSSLGLMKVLVDFDGKYALCHIVYSQPTFCEITHLRSFRTEKFALGVFKIDSFDFNKNDIIKAAIYPTQTTY